MWFTNVAFQIVQFFFSFLFSFPFGKCLLLGKLLYRLLLNTSKRDWLCACEWMCVLCNKDQQDALFLKINFNNHHLCVSNRLTIHHQEVALLYMQHMVFIMHLCWLAASTIGVGMCARACVRERCRHIWELQWRTKVECDCMFECCQLFTYL
jgi:hypothetical protein